MRRPTRNYDSNISRRTILRRLGLGALALSSGFGGACGILSGENKKQALNFWGTGTLDIGDWSRFVDSRSVAIEFEDNQNDPGPVIAKLILEGESKTRHISGLQGGAEAELAEAGAIIPWDIEMIPNLTKLWPWAKEIAYTFVDGQRYGIPAVINADSMIYRSDELFVDSYESVFDPDLAGKTSMEDAWINSVIFTAIYLKESGQETIDDPGNLTETELSNVMYFLKEKAKAGQFRKLWSGWTDGVDLITSGEVWVMTGWEPIVYEAQRRGVEADYAVPKEGYEGWSNDLLLHPGVERDGLLELAHEFVNWELNGFYGARLASTRGYVVPTDATVAFAELHPEEFDPTKVKETVENVKKKFFQMKGNVYWQNVRPDNYRLYEEEWAQFRALV